MGTNENELNLPEGKKEDYPKVKDDNVSQQFVGLSIETLICAPIIVAVKGQQELTASKSWHIRMIR